MPIMAEHRLLYPIDWPELPRAIRFGRANGRCEHCHRPHGQRVFHLGDGRWWDMDGRQWRDGRARRVRGGAIDLVALARITRVHLACDRKSVVWGQMCAVRVDAGGGGGLKNKKT